MTRIDGTVTFNPTNAQLQHIMATLVSLGGSPCLVDNSLDPERSTAVAKAAQKRGITVLHSGANIGTAAALNLFLREALLRGADSIHYLDQDSRPDPSYKDALDKYRHKRPSAAVVGATYGSNVSNEGHFCLIEPVSFVISSGSWFDVGTLVEIGGHDERMFLDLVDHEICLRMASLGFEVAIDHGRHMSHSVGEDSRFVAGIAIAKHPTWRRKLMWTNSLILFSRYHRKYPRLLSRHLVLRVYESLLAAIILRRPDYVFAGVRGVVSFLATRPNRRKGF